MQVLLAVALVVIILVVTQHLHRFLLRAFCDAAAPAASTEQVVQQAVADLDREYEDLVRRSR